MHWTRAIERCIDWCSATAVDDEEERWRRSAWRCEWDDVCLGVLNGHVARSLHSPPVAFEDIERRVNGPLPYSQVSSQQRQKFSPFVHSEPGTRDSSIPGDAADLLARPMSSTHNAQYRLKTLPPIQSQATQQQRPKGLSPSSNKADQLLANQRRIARFIKHIKWLIWSFTFLRVTHLSFFGQLCFVLSSLDQQPFTFVHSDLNKTKPSLIYAKNWEREIPSDDISDNLFEFSSTDKKLLHCWFDLFEEFKLWM